MTENEACVILNSELKHHPEASIFYDALSKAIKALEEVQQYRQIGTVEECRAAMEKPTAYDPDKVVEQLEDYLFEKYCVEGDTEIDRIVKAGGTNDNSN